MDFEMGQQVEVLAIAIPHYEGKTRTWIRSPLKESRVGWVVGYSYKQEGDYRAGSNYEDSSSPYLAVSNTVKLARIKLSKNSNDSFAFFDDLI
jgi:hypothetical protein